MKRFPILLICFLGLSAKVFGQQAKDVELWGDFNYSRFINSKCSVGGDAGVRTDVSHGNSWRMYVNPEVSYRLDEIFTFKGNMGLYQNWNKSTTNSTEFRLSQEANAKWPNFPRFSFKNRFKVEERFISYTTNRDDNSASIPNSKSYRFRYRLIGQTDYFNLSKGIVDFYALGLAEFFIPISNSGTRRNPRQARLGVGFGQLLPKGRHYEVNLLWQGSYEKKITDANDETWIIRFRYYLKSQPFNKS